jgi:hypothetical protein
MIHRSLSIAVTLGLVLAAAAGAQTPTLAATVSQPAPRPVVQATAPATVGPVLRSSAVSEQARPRRGPLEITDPMTPPVTKHQSTTMMIVGGAGLIVGAIIGGTPGTLVMVGGGVLGLFGLYYYLQ